MVGETMNSNTLFSPLNLNQILGGISKSLDFVKEIIPVYQELKPMLTKVKTIFKTIMTVNSETDELKKTSHPQQLNNQPKKESNSNFPVFFN